jgi:hypothetical protein
MIIIRAMLFALLLALLYYGYHVLNDRDPFYQLLKTNIRSSSDVFPSVPPEPDKTALGFCTIDTQDLYNYNVFTYDNKQVSTTMSPIPCSTCNQYIFRDSGDCSQYMFDQTTGTNYDDSKNIDSFCDPKHPDRDKNCIPPHGMCSVSPVTKKCSF